MEASSKLLTHKASIFVLVLFLIGLGAITLRMSNPTIRKDGPHIKVFDNRILDHSDEDSHFHIVWRAASSDEDSDSDSDSDTDSDSDSDTDADYDHRHKKRDDDSDSESSDYDPHKDDSDRKDNSDIKKPKPKSNPGKIRPTVPILNNTTKRDKNISIQENKTQNTSNFSNKNDSHTFMGNKNVSNRNLNLTCSDRHFYYFPNGTCSAYCPSDIYVRHTDNLGQLFCSPCDFSCATCREMPARCTSCSINTPYLYSNQTCLATCPSETHKVVKIENKLICEEKLFSKTESYLSESTSQRPSLIEKLQNFSRTGGSVTSFCLTCRQIFSQKSAGTISTFLIINLIQHIKYLDINFPLKLKNDFKTQLNDLVSFTFTIPFPGSSEGLREYRPEQRFSRYNIYSLFIVNFWEETITALIFIGLACLVKVLSEMKFESILLTKAIKWAKDFFIWNFLITIFLNNLGKAVLFAIVEYSNLKLTNPLSKGSFLLNLGVMIFYCLLEAFIAFTIYSERKHKSFADIQQRIKLHHHLKVIFENEKNDHILQEILILVTTSKVILSSFILGIMNAPVIQAIFLMILSLIMIAYFGIYRPFKQSYKNIEFIFYELLVFSAEATCLRLSLQESSEQYNDYFAQDTITVINFVLILLALFFQVLELILDIKNAIKTFLNKRKSEKIHPLPPSHGVQENCTNKVKQELVYYNGHDQDKGSKVDTISKLETKESLETFGDDSPKSDITQPENVITVVISSHQAKMDI